MLCPSIRYLAFCNTELREYLLSAAWLNKCILTAHIAQFLFFASIFDLKTI